MKKILHLVLFVLTLNSCQNKEKVKNLTEENNTTDTVKNFSSESNQTINETENAKEWLIETIETYFKKDLQEMRGITTKSYEEYKTDATNVDLDTEGALTQTEFENKWKGKFDIKYAGIGNGFLISGQDWGKIEVTKCNSLKSNSKDEFVFETTISDIDFKVDYKREIKVIKSENSFLISDVKEYE